MNKLRHIIEGLILVLSHKEITDITEKITRRYEIELPLQIDDFSLNEEKLYISFHKKEISSTFELAKGIIIEFDNDSRIIGLKIESVTEFLPRSPSEINEV